MKRILIFLLLFCAGMVLYVGAQNIIANESSINFTIKNAGINVKGSLPPPKGTVVFDANNLPASHFDVDIDVTGINTNIPKRDNHLRSEDFFDVQKYPSMHFVSSSIVRTSKGYIAYGKLKIKDVEKKVGLPFTYTRKGNSGLLDGTLVINRLDYGVGDKSVSLNNDVSIFIKVAVDK